MRGGVRVDIVGGVRVCSVHQEGFASRQFTARGLAPCHGVGAKPWPRVGCGNGGIMTPCLMSTMRPGQAGCGPPNVGMPQNRNGWNTGWMEGGECESGAVAHTYECRGGWVAGHATPGTWRFMGLAPTLGPVWLQALLPASAVQPAVVSCISLGARAAPNTKQNLRACQSWPGGLLEAQLCDFCRATRLAHCKENTDIGGVECSIPTPF